MRYLFVLLILCISVSAFTDSRVFGSITVDDKATVDTLQIGGVTIIGIATGSADNDSLATKGWINENGGGGSSTFLMNTDTPSSYSGQSGKVVTVKATEDGLEFTTPSGTGWANKIEEGNTSIEVIDTGTGEAVFTIDGTEVLYLYSGSIAPKADIIPKANNTYDLGSDTYGFDKAYIYEAIIKEFISPKAFKGEGIDISNAFKYGWSHTSDLVEDGNHVGRYWSGGLVGADDIDEFLPLYIDSSGYYALCDSDFDHACQLLSDVNGVGKAKRSNAILPNTQVTYGKWNWTVGGTYGGAIWVSSSGALTQTKESTTGNYIIYVGFAMSADTIWFLPSPVTVEVP